MDTILQFIRDHYHVLTVCTLELIVLFVTLFKKKVKVNDVFQSVLMVLPDLIALAESKYDEGSEKYSFVFNKCLDLLHSLTHRSNEKLLSDYASDIDKAIESILATPQKKER